MFKVHILCLTVGALLGGSAYAKEKPHVDEDGTIHVPAFQLPESSFLSKESRAVLKRQRDAGAKPRPQPCPSVKGAGRTDIPAIRQCLADAYYKTPVYAKMRELYDVTVTSEMMGGVYSRCAACIVVIGYFYGKDMVTSP